MERDMREINNKVKLLVWDIEVIPFKGFFYNLRDKYRAIPTAFIEKHKSICTIAYKFIGDSKTTVMSVDDFPKTFNNDVYDDSALITEFSKVIAEADRAIAHYGDKFDVPFLNTRAAYAGLTSLKLPSTIDTCKLAKKHFTLDSNSLSFLASFFKLEGKDKMEAGDWIGFINKEKDSIEKMKHYNAQDVDLLEQVYYKMLPYVKTNLDMRAFASKLHGVNCECCGSDNVKKNGRKVLSKKVVQNFQCLECGKNFYDTKIPYLSPDTGISL